MRTREFYISHPIPPKDWGRDHASTLLYIESCNVDHRGRVDRRRLREDGDEYPTILRAGVELPGHDDWNCITDMRKQGLVTSPGGDRVKLTEAGWHVAGLLRRHRANGGWDADFDWSLT